MIAAGCRCDEHLSIYTDFYRSVPFLVGLLKGYGLWCASFSAADSFNLGFPFITWCFVALWLVRDTTSQVQLG